MTETKRKTLTPLPWRMGDELDHAIELVNDNGDICVATVSNGESPNDQPPDAWGLAHAAFIFKACNSHSASLEALKLAELLIARLNHAFYVEGTSKALRPIMGETKAALGTIRNAIAKAEASAD